MKLTLAQCLFHTGNRFDQVLEDGFFTGFNIHRSNHARNNRHVFTVFVFQSVVLSLDDDSVVNLVGVEFQVIGAALHGVADGIGADEGNFAIQTTVDGVVICADFDQSGLSCADKGDVLRTDIGFDKKFVVNGDDLHDFFARVDYAANGIDFDAVSYTHLTLPTSDLV